jgi:long-chain acyl-CoA synthetase
VTVNAEELAKFAREKGIVAPDPSALVKHPAVVERVKRTIDEKNEDLQSYAKVKRFAILAGDFSQEGGELTPTLKVKRKVVAEKHRNVIETLYV